MSYVLFCLWCIFASVSYLIVREAILENWFLWSSWYNWVRILWHLSSVLILGLLIPKKISIRRKDLLVILWFGYIVASIVGFYTGGVRQVLLTIILGLLILDKPTKEVI